MYKSDPGSGMLPLPDHEQEQLELELEPDEEEFEEADDLVSEETTNSSVGQAVSLPPVEPEKVYEKTPVVNEVVLPAAEPKKRLEEEEEEEEDLRPVDVAAYALLDEDDLLYFDEDDDELEDLEEEEWEDEIEIKYPKTFPKTAQLQILPLSSAALPKTCYLVIDRAAELITRPLKEFAELGKIPAEEVQQKTLPVFDNHRVARRFSKRRERVIKIPDGRMIQKTRSYLEAKGITRLLLDGQIYSL